MQLKKTYRNHEVMRSDKKPDAAIERQNFTPIPVARTPSPGKLRNSL